MQEPAPGDPSRRRFLRHASTVTGGLAASSLLAACGLPRLGTAADPRPPILVPLFSSDHVIVAGRPQRIPVAVVAPEPTPDDGAATVALPRDGAPVPVTIRFGDDIVTETTSVGLVVAHDHVGTADPDHQHANLFRYYPIRAELPEPGIYDLAITVTGDADGGTAVVAEMPLQAFDAADAKVPLTGDPLPVVATPTFDDPGGVDRLCTRPEPCPFHAESLDRILADGRPVAVLVATPAFCSTAYCGPVLDTLIEQAAAHPDLAVVHVEVYANPDEVNGNFNDPAIRLAPAVDGLGLRFEPSLFLVGGDGRIADRIDNVFDGTEVAAALAALT